MVRHIVLVPIVMVLGAAAVACSDDDASGGPGGSGGSSGSNGDNVEFAEVCAPPPDCGGDPTGSWTLVDACVQPPTGGFHCTNGLQMARGTTEATLTLGTSDYSMEHDSELRQCGWIDGSSSSDSGSVMQMGNVLNLGGVLELTFCVEGESLWFYDPLAEYSDLTVMHFTRTPTP